MNLLQVSDLANGPFLQLIEWLQANRVIPNPLRCLPCQMDMTLTLRNEHVDGYLWRCPGCRTKKSLRAGSFFEEFPKTSLGKLLTLLYLCSERELRTTAAHMVGISKNSVGNFYALLRHYCGRDIEERPIVPFGGPACIVKCDESQFNHKAKYQRGRRARHEQWVFGVLSTESSPCRGYFQVVPRRDRATLAPILQRVLLPGSELHSDNWPGYRNLVAHVPNLILHQVVVHRDNFVDPLRGIHTQEAEAAWNRLKYYIKREKGIRRYDLQSFLNEQMWRDWRGLGNDFDNVIQLLAHYYPLA